MPSRSAQNAWPGVGPCATHEPTVILQIWCTIVSNYFRGTDLQDEGTGRVWPRVGTCTCMGQLRLCVGEVLARAHTHTHTQTHTHTHTHTQTHTHTHTYTHTRAYTHTHTLCWRGASLEALVRVGHKDRD